MSDVDIVLEIATKGVEDVYKLSNAMTQLNRAVNQVANPMKNLDARSRALSLAVGSADSSLKSHAKTIGQLSRNQAILSNEMGRVRKEIAGLGTEYKSLTGTSASWSRAGIRDLQNYEKALKRVRVGALVEDLKSVAQEQKRLGKDAQFVGRSLIIGLTTPILAFGRYGLQAVVAVDKEFVRLNKVLEGVAPNLEAAAQKMDIDLVKATQRQKVELNKLVDSYNYLDKSLSATSAKFGISKSLTVGLAADFAELGVQSTISIAEITRLTAATEKLGNMDIGASKSLVQSLYFQARRSMEQSGESAGLTSEQFETKAIAAATSQLNLFNLVENQTALSMKDLGDAFPEVAAAATTFGLSMTEAVSLLAPMKAAGMEVGASANAIKISLQSIVKPTRQTKDLFEKLTGEYGDHFDLIKGSGLSAIQALIDAYDSLSKSAAGQEGVLEFFTQVFGKRQGTRMLLPIQQLAEFNSVLADTNKGADSADARIQAFANNSIAISNKATDAQLPLIKSYTDIGIVARVATAQAGDAIEGFSASVTEAQIKAARGARDAVSEGIKTASNLEGIDLIGRTATEAGKIMYIELAGVKNAQEQADRELAASLASLDTSIQRTKNAFKNFASDIIEILGPSIKQLSETVSKFYDAWVKLDPAIKSIISKFAIGFSVLAAAIGPMIFILGQFRLAIGSVLKVFFGFLPALKTMTVGAVASSSAMLRLTKPLTVVGDTVVNTSGKFATLIATMASGTGPMAKYAEKLGQITGVLQKTTTANTALTTSVMQIKNPITSALNASSGAFYPTPTGAPIGSAMTRAEKMTKDAAKKAKEALKLSGLTGKVNIVTPTGPGGQFVSSRVDAANAAITRALALEKAGFAPGAIGVRTPSGRMRAVSPGDRAAFDALQKARESLVVTPQQFALRQKGIELDKDTGIKTFRGRTISDKRASDLFAGKAGARVAESLGRTKDLVSGKVDDIGGFAKSINPVKAYRASIVGAKASVATLTAEHLRAGVAGPGAILRMKVAMSGFMNATKLGTLALKLMKLAFISSGIGAILLAVAVGFVLIKNNMDKFKTAGSSGLKVVAETFHIVKNAVLEIVRPIVDLFAHFGNGSKGASGAVEGIGNAFNGLAKVLKWVAGMFAMVVDKFIKPYLYMIVNIVGAVVSLFQGNWKKAFSFLMAAVAFAVEFFVNAFATGFKLIVSLAGGLIKGIVSILGFLGKALIEQMVMPITAVLKVASMLPFGIGEKFKGINDKFRGVVNGAKGLVDSASGAVNGAVTSATNATNGFIDKAAGGIKNKIKGLKKGGIDASTGKVKLFPKEQELEVDTDPAQEKITNAVGDGIEDGADKGAAALAKKLANYSKSLKEELQTDIQDRIKNIMKDVVDKLTEGLKDQKEASLKIFDDQIAKIEETAKAEERLTKTKEYENKKREMEEARALNKLNNQRSYSLAVYEGRIDDARQISLEGRKAEAEAQKESVSFELARGKELADEKRSDLIESIKTAKDIATKYFDDAIKAFVDAAKKITEFPPTTAEKFNEQLESLRTAANNYGTSAGDSFSSLFTGSLAALGVNAAAPLKTSLDSIAETITANNPFGENGVWQTTIDASIEGMKQKYIGLTDTLNTAVGESSAAFKELFDIYVAYKDLVAKNESETGDGAGGGTSGGTGGTGGGTGGTGGTGGGTGGTGGSESEQMGKKGIVTPQQLAQKMLANYRGGNGQFILNNLSTAFKMAVDSPYESAANVFKKFLKTYPTLSSKANASSLKIIKNLYTKGATTSGYEGYRLYANGGAVPGFRSQGVPSILHGGEYVVNSSAVKNIGLIALQAMNDMRFNTPKSPSYSGGVQPQTTSSSNVNIYVDNFIGEKQWFESMMKDYNINVGPQNQKNAGLQNRTISTYNGLNRGL